MLMILLWLSVTLSLSLINHHLIAIFFLIWLLLFIVKSHDWSHFSLGRLIQITGSCWSTFLNLDLPRSDYMAYIVVDQTWWFEYESLTIESVSILGLLTRFIGVESLQSTNIVPWWLGIVSLLTKLGLNFLIKLPLEILENFSGWG